MPKPKKSWEPTYHFGGDKSSFYKPMELGRTNTYKLPKSKKRKK